MPDETWVIIPAYNEGKRIEKVIQCALKQSKNVIVVDDGSRDRTGELAVRCGAKVIRHAVNLGKGGALKTGCDFAIEKKAKVIVVLDADGQHDPADIPRFIEQIRKGNKIVFGYREGLDNMPGILRLGNLFINIVTSILYGIRLRDTQSGYRAFTADAYKKIRWEASDYSMESEMIANLGKRKMKYTEIPIPTIYHDSYKGTTVMDGVKIVFNMIMWRLTR